MRTIQEIKDQMTEMFMAQPETRVIYDKNPLKPWATTERFDRRFSLKSIENVIFYAIAHAQFILETLFDQHRQEMEQLYEQHHAHTLNWYILKSKAFMLGYTPIRFTSNYDTTTLTDEQIATAQIITQASCQKEVNVNGGTQLRIKVAKGEIGSLEALNDTELEAFTNYINEIQDAGVTIVCVSLPADHIRMTWTIYYNPQILNDNGEPLTGGNSVVRAAIINYVQQLSFNGIYNKTKHVDAIQAVEGVITPVIESVEISPAYGDIFTGVPESGTVAQAGYFEFIDDDDLVINYIPNEILY